MPHRRGPGSTESESFLGRHQLPKILLGANIAIVYSASPAVSRGERSPCDKVWMAGAGNWSSCEKESHRSAYEEENKNLI